MIKSILFIVLSFYLFLNIAHGQQCTVFISTKSTNSNNTCGSTQADPCPSLYIGIQACEALNQTSQMTFNFANGSYQVPNSIQLSIYNQQVTINGILGSTILTFENQTAPVLVINLPANAKGGITGFALQNIIVQGLESTFVKSNLNTSMLIVSIVNCTFDGTGLTLVAPLFDLVGPSNINSEIIIQDSEFSNYQNGNNDFPIFYRGNQYQFRVTNSIFTKNTASSSLFTSIGDQIVILNSQFINNQVNGLPLFDIQQSQNVIITNQTQFSGNSLLGLVSATNPSSPIISIQSGFLIDISDTVFNQNINLVGLFLDGKSNDASLARLQFTQNQPTTSFIAVQNGVKFTVSNTLFLKNSEAQNGLISINSSQASFQFCSYNSSVGLITNIIADSVVQYIDPSYQNDNQFQIFFCGNSNVTYLEEGHEFENLMSSKEVVCSQGCRLNGLESDSNGCVLPVDSDDSKSSENMNKNKSDTGKIIAIVIIVAVAVAVIGFVAFYFLKIRKHHHYTQL